MREEECGVQLPLHYLAVLRCLVFTVQGFRPNIGLIDAEALVYIPGIYIIYPSINPFIHPNLLSVFPPTDEVNSVNHWPPRVVHCLRDKSPACACQ